MKLQNRSGLAAVIVALIAAGAMAVPFAVGESGYQSLSHLPAPSVVTGQGHLDEAHQININIAGEEELDKLPGIGAAKAAAIVAWRGEHGLFRYPEELLQVPGIGEEILAEILNQITVGGE